MNRDPLSRAELGAPNSNIITESVPVVLTCTGRNDDWYLANIGIHGIAVERNDREHRVTACRQPILEIELERGAFAKRGSADEDYTLLIVDNHEPAFRERPFQHIRRYG